jgi:hypothetical protein
MRLSKSKTVLVVVAALVVAVAVISPALGGPSLKKLIRKEVAKQLRNKQGPAGASFNANTSLGSGETLAGVWAVAGGMSSNAPDAIQFAPQLPTALGPGAVHRLAPGGTSSLCPGQGQAAAGQLCVYERASANASFNTIADPANGDNGANRRGAVIEYTTSAANGYADGTWAVTAP